MKIQRMNWAPVVVAGGFLLVAAFFSLLLTQGLGRLLIMAIFGLGLFASLVMYGITLPGQKALSWILVLVFVVTLSNAVVEQLVHAPIGYVFELLCFGLILGAGFHAARRFGADSVFRFLLLCLGLYFLLGLVSTALGRSQWVAAIWQLQYNLKWPAMLLIGMLLAFNHGQERLLRIVVGWAWLPIAMMVALEIASPNLHWKIVGGTPDMSPNPVIGLGLRNQGPFPHSGYLALTSAGFAWISLVFASIARDRRWLLPTLLYTALLLSSGQRQEVLGFFILVGVLFTYLYRRHWQLLLVGFLISAAMALVVALIFDVAVGAKLVEQWGGSKLGLPSERYVLSKAGLKIAHDWFPLGSGLGTYGGAGAQKFDQSQFLQFGFDQYWWFRQGQFLVDVYWPSVVAEVGWIGGVALFVAYMAIFVKLIFSAWQDGEKSALLWIGFGLLGLLLLNSPTSASISDPRSAFWMWLLIGAAFAHALKSQGGDREVVSRGA